MSLKGDERSINGGKCQTWWVSFKNALLQTSAISTGHTTLQLQQSITQKPEVPDHLQNNLYTFKGNGKQYKARPVSAHPLQKANSSTLNDISDPSLLAALSVGQKQPGLLCSYNLDCSCYKVSQIPLEMAVSPASISTPFYSLRYTDVYVVLMEGMDTNQSS